MQKVKYLVFIALFNLLYVTPTRAQHADFHVIPLPREVKATHAGNFELSERVVITYSGKTAMKRNARFLASYIRETTGLDLPVVPNVPGNVRSIRLVEGLRHDNPEAYRIRVNSDVVLLEGSTPAGVFYAVQTLRKALPVGKAKQVILPGTEVNDCPRFSYRGAHLDVARHFVTTDSVKRFIDMLALHNINRFHWHLTDDQGWRIELKKYPQLTKVGSQRAQTVIGHNSGRYDGKPHGGYYTRKQIKDIIDYASERFVTIIPEVDMPGHMQAALAAYPKLGCTGGPYKVWEMWGVSEDVLCAGNPETYRFIEGVLDEVTELFPSPYIHVGGDECPKARWKACPRCQAFIKAHSLEGDNKHSAEERLQSYLIKHAESYLLKKGRRMIGWDETLEGGLAPNATVMSWRGEGGGIEAAHQKHPVIMSPNTCLYFDYYQSAERQLEPQAIGGYIPLEKVYEYEPVPAALSPEEQSYIIGVQANCWTEYLPTYRNVEYMELPRMAALSEVQWSLPAQKDYASFLKRLQRLAGDYRLQNYHFATVIYRVGMDFKADTARRAIVASLHTIDGADIRYTLDGSQPSEASPRYVHPLVLTSDCTLRAAAFRPWCETPEVGRELRFNLSTAAPICLLATPHPSYTFGGAGMLADGLRAQDTNYGSGRWLGFVGMDAEAVITLPEGAEASRATIHTCVEKGSWIFDARAFEVYGSTDGEHYSLLASEAYPAMQETDANEIKEHTLKFAPTRVRYLKVRVVPEYSMPAWHPGAGHPAFVFIDEVMVD